MARFLVLLATAASFNCAIAAPSFVVTNDEFQLNGAPITLMSGSFHYHRCHPSLWQDRLQRLAAMGLNAIQFYVPWNWHETARGEFDWGQGEASRNLSNFLTLAQEAGLLALVRAGPYICGEHDLGGIPARLLTIPGIVLRSNNTVYLDEVDAWWSPLMSVIKPHLVSNGGNVAMVQMENEFGSYGNTGGVPADADYIRHLKTLALSGLGGADAVQLYTTDGGDAGYLSHGALPGEIFATGDGGPDIDPPSFWAAEDQFNPAGMRAHTDSEYYTGWLTHWSEQMANTSTMAVVSGISVILAANGSFDLYMAYGGTNWGFWNGANGGGTSFQPVITSYDYNSPVAESGTHGYSSDGDKYLAMKQVLSYWAPVKGRSTPFPPEPALPIATAYGPIPLSSSVNLFDPAALAILAGKGGNVTSPLPQSLEQYGLKHGYALFTTPMPADVTPGQASVLAFGFVADLAYVWCGPAHTYVGSVYRPDASLKLTLPASCVQPGGMLTILLQNAGHINYGHGFFDPKGLFPAGGPSSTGPVASVGGTPLPGPWTAVPMEMHFNSSVGALQSLYAPVPNGGVSGPAFYEGTLNINAGAVSDTFLSVCGWGKGSMWVNGFHLGRYWESAGPQHSFYVPSAILVSGPNSIVLFEELASPAGYIVTFGVAPDFTGASCKGQGQRVEFVAVAQNKEKARSAVRSKTTAGSCPSSSYAAGQPILMQTCAGAAASAAWTWTLVDTVSNTGVLSLAADSTLCLAVNDTAASAGAGAIASARASLSRVGRNSAPGAGQARVQGDSTNMVLAPCSPANADRSQHFMYFQDLPGSAFMSVTRGNCLDVTGGGTDPGTQLEVYGCTGNSNQGWTVASTANGVNVVSHASGLCIAACAA